MQLIYIYIYDYKCIYVHGLIYYLNHGIVRGLPRNCTSAGFFSGPETGLDDLVCLTLHEADVGSRLVEPPNLKLSSRPVSPFIHHEISQFNQPVYEP